MTPEEHNKTLGTLHYVYGGFQALTMLVTALILFLFFAGANSSARGGGDVFEAGFIIAIMSVITLFGLILMIPSFVAGYGLKKQKSWAKLWGIIAGVVAGMSFPLGTALCVYTIWFLLGEGGRELYGEAKGGPKRREALYGAPQPAGWAAQYASREREREYAPPPPPNWRD